MADPSSKFLMEVQSAVLRVLNDPSGKPLWTSGQWSWVTEVQNQMSTAERVHPPHVHQSVWSLIRQGLAYVETNSEKSRDWKIKLTHAGVIAAQGKAWNPDDAGEYVRRLKIAIPNGSPEVFQYAREAESSYLASCYLSCMVMIGVSAEAAFLDMARSFARWVGGTEGQKFSDLIEKKGQNFVRKFDDFRKRIEPKKAGLPEELASGLGITLLGIGDLLRLHRNDAGHPTGATFDHDTVFAMLQMFPVMLRKMYALKDFFDNQQSQQGAP